ncbi:chemotaxis protein CheW [Fulvimarina endophytica]|uniref:Chemotaxis protein CheW n=1 Tax=Fulvimarina endophytica TaxID=2293836 RepID=A0A371X0B6_9HYPH|nr:chemotaxis protein CheW [Fulvimarina endophytica]RFC62681.1 chemotaxis protein CheW [Fulvimarina endophytica]
MNEHKQYVTLGVADAVFAIPVARVQEILEPQPTTRMPRAPSDFLGMIDVRGQNIPVVDLRLRLEMPGAEDTKDTRILVLDVATKTGMRKIALRADRVFEVAELDEAVLEPPAEVGRGWRSDCIEGVGRRNGGFVMVFDLDLLFHTADLSGAQAAA